MFAFIRHYIYGSQNAAVLFIGLVFAACTVFSQERLLNDTSGILNTGGKQKQYLTDSLQIKINRIQANDVFRDLTILASDSMEGRGIGTRGFERVSRWVEKRLNEIGVQPLSENSYRQYFSVPKKVVERRTHFSGTVPDTLTTWNVMGMIPGTDSVLKDEIIMLTAHLDHIGRTDDSIYYGANDNASGVAAMLNAARFIAHNPIKRTLVVAAFSGEESGLLGSYFFILNPAFDPDRIILMLNLDLVGSGADGIMLQGGEKYFYQQSMIESINRSHFQFRLTTRPNSPNSDHYFFNVSGVPAMFMYAFNGRCPYHSPGDHPDCIDKYVLLNVTKFVSSVTWVMGTLR